MPALTSLILLLAPKLALAQEAPPVVNGSTTADYEQVGVLLICESRGCSDFCSGSLVDERWVVTAAHCVDALQDYMSWGYEGYFGVGPNTRELTDYAEISASVAHPDYDDRNLQNDIGVVELSTAITSVEPVAMNTESLSSSWIGTELRYVGFGVTGDSRTDSGTKRYGDIPIYDYDSQFVVAYDGVVNVCSGDSGGAGLLLSGSSYTLVAVNSYVTPQCEGGATGGARVDQYVDWVQGFISGEEVPDDGDTDDEDPGDDDPGNDDTDIEENEDDPGDVDDETPPGGPDPVGFGEVESTSFSSCSTGAAPVSGLLALAGGLFGLLRRRRR